MKGLFRGQLMLTCLLEITQFIMRRYEKQMSGRLSSGFLSIEFEIRLLKLQVFRLKPV